jgi:hypothetical protein
MKGSVEAAITPVILIPANSLFLLTLSNRYSVVTMRVRQLSETTQLALLYKRVLLLKLSILLDVIAEILQLVLVLVLLLTKNTENTSSVRLFMSGVICMIMSALTFLVDIFVSSYSLRMHIISIDNNNIT